MKLAVIFPGIGYHTDKPLLYYGKKLAASFGYEIKEVCYVGFPENVKGSKKKMEQAFYTALEDAEVCLKKVDFEKYDKLLFISKSIGTVVAAAYAKKYRLCVDNIFYTPVEAFFSLVEQPGAVFHGTKDPWVETEAVIKGCQEKELPLYITEGANHSLEIGDVEKDLQNLQLIMEQCKEYLFSIEQDKL